jgi:Cu2+-exporting ATPase/Cu+-exporting ATPase
MSTNTQRYLFHIKGIKCTNCIAKIRAHISENHSEIKNLKLNLSNSSLDFLAGPDFATDSLKTELSQLGFEASQLDNTESEKERADLKERHDFLIRLGVAAACTGNSMLVSFALYLGSDQTPYKGFLSWAAFIFYLPIVFFSAKPLIKGALESLRALKPSIDVPIALAIIVGGVLSLYSLSTGRDDFYFDSLSMLVFLILCTRFMVLSIRQNHLTPLSLTQFFKESKLKTITEDGGLIDLEIDKIKPGQILLLEQEKSLPFDSELLSEQAEFDTSVLTGESYPQLLKKHDTVFAGSICYNENVKVKVLSTLFSSRFSKILESVNELINEKNRLVSMTDRGAQLLTYLILSVSVLFLVYPSGLEVYEKVIRVLALLVIACPCALAIATPLALSLSVRSLFKNDVLIKNLEAFEVLKDVRATVFDKTGTLTSGTLDLKAWTPRPPNHEESMIIYNLEKRSKHPVAKAILRALVGDKQDIDLQVFEEPGIGVSAHFKGSNYSLKQSKGEESFVDFIKEGEILISASFNSTLVDDARATLKKLDKLGVHSYLLTGDKKIEALSVGKRLGFKSEHIFFEHSPEMKLKSIQSLQEDYKNLIYIGDGLNDCMAMTGSSIGVSVHSSLEETFKTSDVHFLKPGVSKIIDLINSSKRLYFLLKTNLSISFIYNISFGAMALSGLITPFLTAVIMPISSFVVVGLTFFIIQYRDK